MNVLIKYLYNRYKKDFLKLMFHDQEFKKPDAMLSYQFIDSEGRKYYSYSDATKLPWKRSEALNIAYLELNSSLTLTQSWELLEAMHKLHLAIVNKPDTRAQNIAKATYIFEEFKLRQGKLIREDILWKIFSIMYIREDEKADDWDEEFQHRKIEQLKQDSREGGLYDFFYKKPLTIHLPFANISAIELESYMSESHQELALLKQLQAMLSTEG